MNTSTRHPPTPEPTTVTRQTNRRRDLNLTPGDMQDLNDVKRSLIEVIDAGLVNASQFLAKSAAAFVARGGRP